MKLDKVGTMKNPEQPRGWLRAVKEVCGAIAAVLSLAKAVVELLAEAMK